MVTGSDKGERARYQNVVQSGKFHTGSVLGGINSGGFDVEKIVRIPKGSGEYRGIGLVKTVWKVCMSIVNSQIQSSIVLHDVLHGFIQGGGGAGTAIMEAKLEQQLAWIERDPLLQVFLNIRKAYDSLYQGRCMEILPEYGLGP